MEKNSLNNFICHLSWLEKLSPTHTYPLISICEFSKPCELLFFEFEFWPTPPHPYMTHPTPSWPTHPSPGTFLGTKEPFFMGCFTMSPSYELLFSELVTHKMLNVNCMKIHSVILSVTCHGLRNFASAHTHPLISIHEFSKPYKLLFSELESLIKLYKNLLNNFICHLSWLKKLCLCSYTYPQNHSWIFKTLQVIIFWVRVTRKIV